MAKTDKISNHFAQIKDIIEDIRLGKMVIIVDDEDRENEGDPVSYTHLTLPTILLV